VAHACFSPDGRWLASAGWQDNTARIWNVTTGQPLLVLPHPKDVNHVAFSSDGQRLATACEDRKVRVWDAVTGAFTGPSADYGDSVYCAEFSPDGQRIAYSGGTFQWANSQDASVRIWDLASGAIRRLAGHTHDACWTAWSPKGDLLASAGWDGQVKLWDPVSGRELPPLELAETRGPVLSLAFSPDGSLLAAVGASLPSVVPRAQVFDVRTRRLVRQFAGHSMALPGVSFSPDGEFLATASMDGTAKVWPVAPLPAFLSLEGHDQTVWAVAFSPDGKRVATGSFDQTAKIWDADTGALLQNIRVGFPAVSLTFSHDGQRLATVGPDNSACVWQVELTQEPDRGRSPSAARATAKQTAETPDVWLVAETAATGGAVAVRSATEPLALTRGQDVGEDEVPLLRLRGHMRAVMAVAWSPDDQWLATGSKDKTAKIWSANTGAERLTLAGHNAAIHAVTFAPDGKVLATGSADGKVRLWSVSSGECLRALTNHADAVLSLACSPDGKLLATGGADRTARLWDTRTGQELHLLAGHANGVTAVSFSPDGERLLTAGGGTWLYANASREYQVRLWDVASGRQLLAFVAHTNAVYAAAFSADGRGLVTGSGDNTARIWTAFPWHSADYPGDPQRALPDRIEEFKRQFWRSAMTTSPAASIEPQREADAPRWMPHTIGDLNLPPPGSKTRPLRSIPPRDAQITPSQLDLSDAYNVALNESWQPVSFLDEADLSLAALPPGMRTLAGVAFDVRGLVQLRRAAPDCELFPERVSIAAMKAFRRLHVLHGTRWDEPDGTTIGAFILHYASGPPAELSIVYGEHLRSEFVEAGRQSECAHGEVAWISPAPAGPADWQLRLYKTTFTNPRPEREVVRIDYVSKVTRCGPFLVALTAE
jgi:WD40 repeat protein